MLQLQQCSPLSPWFSAMISILHYSDTVHNSPLFQWCFRHWKCASGTCATRRSCKIRYYSECWLQHTDSAIPQLWDLHRYSSRQVELQSQGQKDVRNFPEYWWPRLHGTGIMTSFLLGSGHVAGFHLSIFYDRKLPTPLCALRRRNLDFDELRARNK